MNGESSGRVLAAHDPWQRPDSLVYGSLREQLSFPYMIRRNGVFLLIDASLTDRLRSMAQILGDSADGEYARAFYYRMTRQGQRSTELLRLAIDQYPDNAPLREEYLRGYFGELAREQAPPQVVEVAKALQGPSAELLAAARHAAKSEWREVALADRSSRRFRGPMPGIPRRWTCASTGARGSPAEDQTRRFGDESIPMIDRMGIMNPTLTLYGLRARAGFAAQPARRSWSSRCRTMRAWPSHMARAKVIIARDALRQDGRSLGRYPQRCREDAGRRRHSHRRSPAEIADLIPAS